MAKSMIKGDRSVTRLQSAGRAADGVVILKPAAAPKHFTRSQIERTIRDVRAVDVKAQTRG